MTSSHLTKQIFTLLTVVIVLGFVVAVYKSAAEDKSSTLSGRVIGTNGEPIAEASIALLYVKVTENGEIDTLSNRSLYPFLRQTPAHVHRHFNEDKVPQQNEKSEHPPFLEAKTDSDGRFTFTGITSGKAQLMVLPMENDPTPQNSKSVPEIQTIKFGKVTFRPHDFSFFPPLGAITFAIKPGMKIEDVEVKVLMEGPPKIQGRLVFKNGEPFADTTIEINIGYLNSGSGIGHTYSRSVHTNANGNFVFPILNLETYALSVNYRGLSAISDFFTVEAGKPYKKVVLTLNGNPDDLSAPPFDTPEKDRYGLPNTRGVWIVNPANGHAYKWIESNDREDAQAKADDEGAHLVTITSEAEQIWLEAVFGNGPYWIGLTDVLKEGEWIWETGEPVTYTNWGEEDEDIDLYEPPVLLKPFIDKDDIQREVKGEEEDYVIMSSRWDEEMIGKWYPAHSKGARRHGSAQMAILEKDGTRSKIYGLFLPDSTPEDQ